MSLKRNRSVAAMLALAFTMSALAGIPGCTQYGGKKPSSIPQPLDADDPGGSGQPQPNTGSPSPTGGGGAGSTDAGGRR